jgi:hypothetical protein
MPLLLPGFLHYLINLNRTLNNKRWIMKYAFMILMLLVPFTLFTACEDDDSYTQKGTVVYMNLEGGFYGIVGDDGNNYDPVNLGEEFRKDSLRILFDYKKTPDQASFHMWGTIIEITRIKKL